MKYKVLVIILFSLIGCARRVPEPTLYREEWKKEKIEIKKPETKLRIGEKLNYTVRWLGINVGKVCLEVKGIEDFQGERVYHIIGTARTNRYLSHLFKVNDEFHSYLRVKDLKPLCFRSKRRERKYRAQSITYFDYQKGKIKFHSILDNSYKEVKLGSNIMDIISALYKFRTMDLRKNKIIIKVSQRAKTWEVDINLLKKGLLELRKHGVIPVFLVSVKAHHGKEYARGQAWIWFTADKKRLPLLAQIKVRIPIVGMVTASLD